MSTDVPVMVPLVVSFDVKVILVVPTVPVNVARPELEFMVAMEGTELAQVPVRSVDREGVWLTLNCTVVGPPVPLV